MKEIKYYASNIDPNLLKTISGRPGELIELILSGNYLNEKTVAEKLFKGKWSDQNFRNVKARAKQILSAYMLVSPTKKNKKLQTQLLKSRKALLIAMYLIEKYKRKEATKFLRKSYKIAIKYGFTRIAHDCTVQLMASAAMERKKRSFIYYSKKMDILSRDMQAEDTAQYYYYKIALNVNTKRGVSSDVFAQYLSKLDAFSCNTITFIQFYYMICVLRDSNTLDYQAMKRSAGLAFGILHKRKGVYGSILQFFTKNKAIAHMATREYEQAQQLLSQSEQYAPPRSFNRGILYFYQAINALYSGNYQIAYRLFRMNRKNQDEILVEQWAVMEAYLYFLRRIGKLDTGTDRFSLGKYLNQTTQIKHDKTGNNINILIGELLVYLVKNRGRFIDRVEAINTYNYKYLKGKDTQRAKWFIRILCLLPRANFHPIALQRIAKRQIENLQNHPLCMGDNFAVEMIPFEDLLALLLLQLEQRVA